MSRRAIFAAVVAALLGCRVYDGRGEVRILPGGTLRANTAVTLRVEAPSGVEEVTLLLDGEALEKTIPANRDVTVTLNAPEGAHRLVARVYEGPQPTDSAQKQLVVDRSPPQVRWEPEPGPLPPVTPILELVSDEPLAPASLEGIRVSTLTRFGETDGEIPVAAELTREARAIRLTFADVLTAPVSVAITPVDLAGNGAPTQTKFEPTPWNATFAAPTARSARGVVRVQLSVSGDGPAEAEILASGVPVTTVRAPDWSADWNTDASPEGWTTLTVRARGWYTSDARQIIVDRTPPRLRCWRPYVYSYGDVGLSEPFELNGEEFCTPPGAVLTVAAGAMTVTRDVSSRCFEYLRATLLDRAGTGAQPGGEEIVISLPSGLADRAGNVTTEPTVCRYPLRVWKRPLGSDDRVVFSHWGPVDAFELISTGFVIGTAPWLRVGYVTREDGALRADMLSPSTTPRPLVSDRLNAAGTVPSSLARAGDGLLWIERAGTGPGQLRAATSPSSYALTPTGGVLNRDPLRDADHPSAVDSWVTWSEETSSATRAIDVNATAPEPSIERLGVADHPVGVRVEGYGLVFAWIERSDGSPWTLRSRERSPFGWRDVSAALNVDPTADAGAPAMFRAGATSTSAVPTVVWAERGRIFARRFAYTWHDASLTSTWVPQDATVLYDDPAAPGRAPQGSETVVAWIVTTPDGERVRARHLGADAQDLGFVDDGPTTRIVGLSVLGFHVAWLTSDGDVFVRELNH